MPKIIYSVWALIAHGRGNECPGCGTKKKPTSAAILVCHLQAATGILNDNIRYGDDIQSIPVLLHQV